MTKKILQMTREQFDMILRIQTMPDKEFENTMVNVFCNGVSVEDAANQANIRPEWIEMWLDSVVFWYNKLNNAFNPGAKS